MTTFWLKGAIVGMNATMDGAKTYIKVLSLAPPRLEPHERVAPFEIQVPKNIFRTLGIGLLVRIEGVMEIIAKRKKDRMGDEIQYQIIRNLARKIQPLTEAD